MGNIQLLLVTDDCEYGRAFGKAMLHISSQIFVDVLGKREFFSKSKECSGEDEERSRVESADLILWDGNEAEGAYGGRIVMISEDPAMAVKNFAGKKFCIYKYSPAQCIAASLFEIYSSLTGKHAANIKRHEVRMLAFSSWSGGSGCTTLAMSVAQELCRFQGRKVLYLSFEEVESTGEFMENTDGVKGAGVYLYHLFKPDRLKRISTADMHADYPAIEGYIVRDGFGVEAFAPAAGRNPLKNLTDEELDVFIASIIDSGRYDAVIMDLGSCISGVSLSCMEMSEKICMVSRPSSSSRENQYIRHLISCLGESVMDKLIKTENMVCEGKNVMHDVDEDPIAEAELSIEKSRTFMQRGEISRIFLDGAFGNSIRALTERMTMTA